MEGLFLTQMTDTDLEFEGFYDGQQDLVDDGTIFDVVVIDGFNGIEEGKAIMTCFVSVAVITPGKFLGYKYKYNAKVYDNDAAKRDKAMKNLSLLDTQAGSPLSKGKLPLTTENIQEFWVGAAHAKIKLGQFTPEPDERNANPRPGNYIAGFGYLRDKMPKATQEPAGAKQQVTENKQAAATQQAAAKPEDDTDIGF